MRDRKISRARGALSFEKFILLRKVKDKLAELGARKFAESQRQARGARSSEICRKSKTSSRSSELGNLPKVKNSNFAGKSSKFSIPSTSQAPAAGTFHYNHTHTRFLAKMTGWQCVGSPAETQNKMTSSAGVRDLTFHVKIDFSLKFCLEISRKMEFQLKFQIKGLRNSQKNAFFASRQTFSGDFGLKLHKFCNFPRVFLLSESFLERYSVVFSLENHNFRHILLEKAIFAKCAFLPKNLSESPQIDEFSRFLIS
eukprot:NP_497507.1 Uncharacterized protein CELE_Y48G9A.12 [Caenorhabditis elegans]